MVHPFPRDDDDYSEILAKALADRLAEAAAEWLHREVTTHWGYAPEAGQRGPDRRTLRHPPSSRLRCLPGPRGQDHPLALLDVEPNIGVTLTEGAMWPAASVCRACTSPIQTPSISGWAKSPRPIRRLRRTTWPTVGGSRQMAVPVLLERPENPSS